MPSLWEAVLRILMCPRASWVASKPPLLEPSPKDQGSVSPCPLEIELPGLSVPQ